MNFETGLHPLQVEAFRRMTPTQKWQICKSLQKTARDVKRSGLKFLNPGWSEDEIEAELKRIFLHART